jgi:hypothetical protein
VNARQEDVTRQRKESQVRLFGKPQKKPTPAELEVIQIRERVRTMRLQLGQHDAGLVDLFALLREDERPVARASLDAKQPEAARLWPDEVPANPATQEIDSKVTFGDWELMRRPGPFTLR